MNVRELHRWDVTPTEAVAIQREFGQTIEQGPALPLERARLIGGMDVSSTKDSPVLTAGIVVWDRLNNQIVDTSWIQMPTSFPYIPGFLSFREIPALSEVLKKLKTVPDVFLVDGQGRAHPRRMGIASHIGLLIDVPTVGVGKSRLTGTGAEPKPEAGSWTPLMDKDEEIGRIVRTRSNVSPVYVSLGNHITLDSAVEIVLSCCRGYRLPEPNRLAHNFVNEMRVKESQQKLL